ncbi:MAG: FAD synthase [Candidatus Harrisonbacteria bacterium CG10_big_fil_rev_8_21_14_0_10_38_8]|uniref:FAD synthase n=1 Tax=Candidatus Harrisonbacteria bacterium CG10_big_fil_rev_8_21_14_0_10_38_8 TaxID=1974582 RepID=A0A2M6WKN8_9BACT|nr:MAG: FAD synthase [Candidatus Harrisonbacteria bacterium CG10_big_fil_rev_8_21_14_0_10_38_8]
MKVLVFGTFDGVHKGHQSMLSQARKLGSHLTVVVALDIVVNELKGRKPRNNELERIQLIKEQKLADEVTLGDGEIGSWQILEKCRPDIIALGYDQQLLESDLLTYLRGSQNPPKIVILKPYKPDKFHNNLHD